jgi:YlmC/YmxH family sporulation protein
VVDNVLKNTEFQMKDVVNVGDGKRLGNVGDLDVNLETGKIDAIVISTSSKRFSFLGREEQIVIPWRNIVKIGTDVILVRYQDPSEYEQKDY